MKSNLFPIYLLTGLCLLADPTPSQSAVIYGNLNAPIPLDLEGLYFNPATGVATTTYPTASFTTAPWLNLIFGGVHFSSNERILPVILPSEQPVNNPVNTELNSFSNYASTSTASIDLPSAGQFTIGTPGYLGFRFQATTGGSVHYGWASFTINNTGAGMLRDYAYESTANTSIRVGAVPEPGTVCLTLLIACSAFLRRSRH